MSDFPTGSKAKVKTPRASVEFPDMNGEFMVCAVDATSFPTFHTRFNAAGCEGKVIHSHAHMRALEIKKDGRVYHANFRENMLEPVI